MMPERPLDPPENDEDAERDEWNADSKAHDEREQSWLEEDEEEEEDYIMGLSDYKYEQWKDKNREEEDDLP